MPIPADIVRELARAETRLAELDVERTRLLARIAALRAEATESPRPARISVALTASPSARAPTTQDGNVALFRSLFRGRTDVYPHRWENTRTGKAGYTPTCGNEWKRGVCEK